MKKHLLFIIDSLGCGGAEKSLLSLLPLLDYSRVDVDLLVFRRGGVFEKYLPSQVRLISHNLYGTGFLNRAWWLLHQLVFSFLLRFGKKRHGAEIHWRSMHSTVKRLNTKYDMAVAYQQGLPSFFVATKVEATKKVSWINADVFKAGYDMQYCKRFYDKIDVINAVSQKLFDLLTVKAPWMKEKLTCIYDIINPDIINSMAKDPVVDMVRDHDNELLITTVGRLTKPKNHLLAVDAAKILKDKGLDFKWFFVGEGEMRTAIKERISILGLEQNVFLLGLKENPYPYMSQADIYVQTSSFEGFGMTIAEAKILYKPVVSTNFDIVYDQIMDRQNGLIAEMKSDSVAEKILELHRDETLKKLIVSNLKRESNTTTISEPKKFMSLMDTITFYT
jgi:glycosyltransferase involved in cell wall biosynthesis